MNNESKTVSIRVGFPQNRDPVFNSPQEAVSSPLPKALMARAKRDVSALGGQPIKSVSWGEREAVFEVLSGNSLVIYEDSGVANWRVEPRRPVSVLRSSTSYRLRYSNNQEQLWVPSYLLNNRLGKNIYEIFPTETEVAVYFQGMLRIDFVVRIDLDTWNPFLFWYETE